MPIGTSYQPGAQQTGPMSGTPRPITPQEAVRMLSLRLPKTPQNSPVPSQLLTSQGGGGTSSLTQLLQALMQAARGGDQTGSREIVSDAYVPPIDHGISPVPRMGDLPPRVTIGDNNRQPFVDPTPTPAQDPTPDQNTPLFDQGIPPIRRFQFRMPTNAGPLF